MKQHITKSQWDELAQEQKEAFWSRSYDNLTIEPEDITIGQMIEFLGDDWYSGLFSVKGDPIANYELDWDKSDNLCDALWEAVKEKLK